jgi:hypothetical protein
MTKPGIIIHQSASSFGDASIIDRWHKERGWDGIGYHFVICNGHKNKDDEYLSEVGDGEVQEGRDINKTGAHARGFNSYIGICLIGSDTFTYDQMKALRDLVVELSLKYEIAPDDILGHYQVSTKTCPGFDVRQFVKNISKDLYKA